MAKSFHIQAGLGTEIYASCQSGLKESATSSSACCVPAHRVLEREDLEKDCFLQKQNKFIFLMSLTEKLDSLVWRSLLFCCVWVVFKLLFAFSRVEDSFPTC